MKKNNKKNSVAIVNAIVTISLTVLVFLGLNYIAIPRIGWSAGFLAIAAVSLFIGSLGGHVVNEINYSYDEKLIVRTSFITGILTLLILLAMLISWVVSWQMFHVDEIKNRLDITEITKEELIEMLPEVDEQGAYSWIDSASARKLATRKTGELTEYVSIFSVSSTCHTAISDGELVKYVPMEYAGFFKAMNSNNIPGYVETDPVQQQAEYVEHVINYSPSAFFSHDLMRHIRNNFPSEYLGRYTFQVSPEGAPTWVIELERACGSWMVKEVYAVALIDAETGVATKYLLEDAPDWVSCIHGDTAQEIYNGYGRMINGFWNFSKLGETATTSDFGYVAINDELCYYSGITSAVINGGDESNLGVMLYNAHTNKAYYCQIPGAEEFSAMAAAEGVVQNFGYEAAFPSLTNVDGALTYVMVLKDSNGIVKQYGMVNYDNFTVVATADTLNACRIAYNKALNNTGDVTSSALSHKTIVVDAIEYIVQGGETTVYIRDTMGNVYKAAFDEGFLFVKPNDSIELGVIEDDSTIKTATLSNLVPIENHVPESENNN